ncbi:MAG: glycosyltransferase, partial [Parachlamydiaceae bacterium]
IFLIIFYFCSVELQANVRMGIISKTKLSGEREFGWRMKIAAENLGWEVFLDETEGKDLKEVKGLDWVVCIISKNENFHPECPNYLVVFQPQNYLDENGNLLSCYQKYDGYLLTIKERESFKKWAVLQEKKPFFIPFYPTVQPIDYKKVELKDIMTMMPIWGDRVRNMKYRKLYKSLDQSGFVKFYGSNQETNVIEKGYMGTLPFDGVSVIDVLQQHGISLIIHSNHHNREGIPSARIFEAAAASTVIISDQNAFVKKHFGDSVFYIDTALSAEEIYKQIENHIKAIRLYPEKALEMAKRSYQINKKEFLMTDQLLRLQAMHEEMKYEREE